MLLAHEGSGGLGWVAYPDVWLMMALLVGGYFFLTRRFAHHAPDPSQPYTKRQLTLYMGGVAILWLGADWPMHELSENHLFSFHMLQHMLFTLVAPGFLLAGIPRWLLRLALRPPRLKAAVRVATRPLTALLIFNVIVAVTHWPALVNLSINSDPAHFVLHVILVVSALIMWWPVIAPLNEMPRLSEPGKMLYLFGQSILPTVPASFLTFADSPIYSAYAALPRLWGVDAVTDQMVAGLIMKIGGGLLLWAVIAVIFFRWHAREESGESESLTWDDFEHELKAWDLRRS
jgi:putative membrane protein